MDAEKIIKFLEKYEPNLSISENSDHYIMPTICHNLDFDDASHKLYLYKNEGENPLFHCYTECSETFNIYQLIIKREGLKGNEIDWKTAYRIFHGKEYQKESVDDHAQKQPVEIKTTFQNPIHVKLNEYPQHMLSLFPITHSHPWALEGIDIPILKKFKIGYSKSYQGVMIPHFDFRKRMVGLRIRTYDPLKIDKYKYMPAQFGGLYYRHPTSLNLFGIDQNYHNILKTKTVYLFEGEKSVLQYEQMLESYELNNSLAVCGKAISNWQIMMLIHTLKVERVYIGFDKEYEDHDSMQKFVESINKQLALLKNFADVYILLDYDGKFRKSESPVDRRRSDFESLREFKVD